MFIQIERADYSGSLSQFFATKVHKDKKFTTIDKDNDEDKEKNCAVKYQGKVEKMA